jgi:hypothetical protein
MRTVLYVTDVKELVASVLTPASFSLSMESRSLNLANPPQTGMYLYPRRRVHIHTPQRISPMTAGSSKNGTGLMQ